MQPDVGDGMIVDSGKRLGDGGRKTVTADESALWIFLSLIDQMFRTAEPDLETNAFGVSEKRSQIGRPAQFQSQSRQQLAEQLRLPGLERVLAFAPAKKSAGRSRFVVTGPARGAIAR